jgi:hypothetical protein
MLAQRRCSFMPRFLKRGAGKEMPPGNEGSRRQMLMEEHTCEGTRAVMVARERRAAKTTPDAAAEPSSGAERPKPNGSPRTTYA